MRILVCFKAVPNWEKILEGDWESFSPDSDIAYAGTGINCFDESALELALRLKEQSALRNEKSDCVAVTVGKNLSAQLSESLYAAGFDEVVVLEDAASEFEPLRVAQRLAGFSEGEGFDLTLTGVQAGMADTGLVPYFLAALLKKPLIASAGDIELCEGGISLTQRGESGPERRQIELPAIVSVGNSTAVLRAVTLRARMGAKGKRPRFAAGNGSNAPLSAAMELSYPQATRKCGFLLENNAKAVITDALFKPKSKKSDFGESAKHSSGEELELPPGLAVLPDTPDGNKALAGLVLQEGYGYFTGAEIISIGENSVTVRKRACASNQQWTKELILPAVITAPGEAEDIKALIVCGTGMGSKENCDMARALAEKTGAGFGLTRPAALCGWGTPEEIIGQSGVKTAPKTALILGASGARAFLAGIEGAECIIAVNTDRNALIFKNADLGLVADAPALVNALLEEYSQKE